MPPVRRHRIGEQMPAVIHPGPDPDALDSAGISKCVSGQPNPHVHRL